MTAAIALASVSSIAIEQFIAQPPRRSADVIPFPAKSEPADDPANDNADTQDSEVAATEQPVAITGPATALIERALLTKAVEIVDRVVEKRNSIPIFGNVRLMAAAGAIEITGTDSDIEIKATIPAAVDAHFATTLPAKTLKDLLKKATASDFVSITNEDDHDTLDFERVDYRLQSLPATDYPNLTPPADNAHVFTMSGADFWDGIDCTMGAVSTEETRYYLNGIFLHTYETRHGLTLRMVATDGHRLYMREFPVPAGAEGMGGVIVPRKAVKLLHDLMKGKACPDAVKIETSASRVRVTFGEIVLTTHTVDGTFPDYMRVVPAHNDKVAEFDTGVMAEAVRAVTLISSERGRAFKLSLSENSARLVVNNPDQGSAKADVACGYTQDEVEIGFNAGYFTDILSIVGDSLTIALAGSVSPALVTGQRAGFTAVLMPMRV